MTKILSIIFVPIIFFLFYFSVIFLTYTIKPEKDKLNTDLVSNTDYKLGDSSSGKQNFSNENLEIIDQEKNERKNIIEKASISVNGISLTISKVTNKGQRY